MFEDTGVDAIMIGRGAIGNPWIFKSILEGKDYIPSKEELLETIRKHYYLLIEIKGEYVAVREMRKHVSAYIKGIPMATEIRRKINLMEKKEEVMDMLTDFFALDIANSKYL